jgi:diguanylate cyclase (GGDEF)-like protein/PAS domain S-box-containing protein
VTLVPGLPLLDALLEAIWLVDPVSLCVVSANRAACQLVGIAATDLVGRPVADLTGTPEDMFFWQDVAAGFNDPIQSETFVLGFDGTAIPVERRVSRVWLEVGKPVFLVDMRDLRQQRQTEMALESLLSELRATLESTGDGILVSDLNGGIRNYNRRFAELWSVPEALLITRDDRALYDHLTNGVMDPAQYVKRLLQIAEQPLLQTTDLVLLRSGSLLERVTLPQFSRGQPSGRVFSFRDITQKADAESRLRLAAKVFESSLDGIFITGPDFKIAAVNPACERLTAQTQAQLVGASSLAIFDDARDPDFFVRVAQHLTENGFWEGEIWRQLSENTRGALQVSWVQLRNDVGKVLQTVCFFRDMTEKLTAQQRIETLAYTDALTGLPNRLLLKQRVEIGLRVAERNKSQFAILFLDLDRFKTINDSLGHAFGDQVLIEVSERIKGCLREVDTLSRLGGDEFVVFLQDADAHGAEIAAKRMLTTMAQAFFISGTSFSLGCSIGVALYPEDGDTLDELIRCADTAMYRVKDRGRGSFRFYQPQMNVDLLSRMKMDHAMRIAMEQRLFRVHYQPQISLQSGALVGVEALIRWTDAQFGNVSPSVFIPLAEESGFIVNIGNWVLEESVRQAAVWQRAGTPVTVSVNVSALQFQQTDFVTLVAGVLRAADLNPTLLELELTESILVQDANEALERLHALAALGIGLSIDDFGTGYSSLAYLKKFPISKLKIDRSFVTGLPSDESDRAIVSATIGMARALKLKVVAEGVENAEQRDYLASQSCESYQGFLCSPALPAGAFEQLMRELPKPESGLSL